MLTHVVFLLLLAALSSPAIAGSTHSGAKARQEGTNAAAARAARADAAVDQMMRADLNKDGTVSREELDRLDPRMSRNFNAADRNRDGQLTLPEFEKLRALSSGGTSGESRRGATTGSGPGTRR
jgi:multidrug resistance efflux pump